MKKSVSLKLPHPFTAFNMDIQVYPKLISQRSTCLGQTPLWTLSGDITLKLTQIHQSCFTRAELFADTFFWQSAQMSVIFSTCCKSVIHVSTNGFKSATWGDVSMTCRVTRLSLKEKFTWLSSWFDIQDQNVQSMVKLIMH